MRWTKIKNIIILMLVIVNLILLALVGVRAWRSQKYERQARERMLTILANNGISFLPEQIPDRLDLTPQRLTLTPPGEAQAHILVGELSGAEAVGARTLCHGTLGLATLSPTGEMEVSYFSGVGPDEAGALERLSELGLETAEAGRTERDGLLTVTRVQLREGVPIPAALVTLTFRSGVLESLSLRRLAGTWEALPPSAQTVTASTALMRFLETMSREGYVCSQVTALYPGYLLSGADAVTLTPAWFVETDTHQRFAVDGATGAVSVSG